MGTMGGVPLRFSFSISSRPYSPTFLHPPPRKSGDRCAHDVLQPGFAHVEGQSLPPVFLRSLDRM